MRSLLYGILGLVVGSVFFISLLAGIPQNVTKTTQANNTKQHEQEQDTSQDTVNDIPLPNPDIVTYHVNSVRLEEYKKSKVIEYGRINPMLYYNIVSNVNDEAVDDEAVDETTNIKDDELIKDKNLPPLSPEDITNYLPDSKGEIPKWLDESEIEDIVEGIGKIEDPKDIIDENTDEVDSDMDESVVNFDWETYESSYVLPRGYLFGYNTTTKKLNIVDIATLEGDILEKGKFPVDKKFYGTSSEFGIRTSPIDKVTTEFHKGLDIATAGIKDANIYAILDGTITQASDNDGYGNYVIIDHGKYSTIYAHMGSFTENLKSGDKVKAGDIIGYVGSTGRSTGPHLHLEFDINGIKLTPKHFLNLMLSRS